MVDKNTKSARVLSSYQVFAIFCNVLAVAVLVVLFVMFEGVISPFHRGFFCDDESIMKPYRSKQTISTALLAVLSVLFVLIAVIGCDCINRYLTRGEATLESSIVARRLRLKQWVYCMIIRLLLGMVGYAFCMILIGMTKVMVGRLRPHFLSVCKPDLSNCTRGMFYDFSACSVKSGKVFKEARKSFPSGHAGSASYAAFFFALYVEYAIRPRVFHLFKPVIQFIVLFGGIAIGLTRISDYFHHWSDVLAGLIIGAVFAYYTIFRLIELPHYYPKTKSTASISEESMSCIESNNASTSYESTGTTPTIPTN